MEPRSKDRLMFLSLFFHSSVGLCQGLHGPRPSANTAGGPVTALGAETCLTPDDSPCTGAVTSLSLRGGHQRGHHARGYIRGDPMYTLYAFELVKPLHKLSLLFTSDQPANSVTGPGPVTE